MRAALRPLQTLLALLALSLGQGAQAANPDSIDQAINALLAPFAAAVGSVVFYSVELGGQQAPLVVAWLIAAGIVCTLAFGFIQFRGFGHALALVSGRVDPGTTSTKPEAGRGKGENSHFQALTMALSGTVGLGNIAGVAVAVTLGGPGATFWMVIAGLLGMASKFTECTLGVKFRRVHADGSVSGGPMYYLRDGLSQRGMPGLGRVLAAVFAVCCVGGALGGGNMFQSNQAFMQVVSVTGGATSPLSGHGWAFGAAMAVVVGIVVVGGASSIGRTTARLVPLMAGVYLVAGLVILGVHADRLGWAFQQILHGAFTAEGVTGGALGALIQGFRRAAFSSEAGIGSAAIAHSTVKTDRPVTEGYVALLEPFIDTVVICTLTALVIIVTGASSTGLTGVELTSAAYASALPWFPVVLAVAVVLFAFSTMLSWFYYGQKAYTYLTNGRGKTLYTALFLCATVAGATVSLGAVIDLSDAMIFVMAIPNVIGLYLLLPVVRAELQAYAVHRSRLHAATR